MPSLRLEGLVDTFDLDAQFKTGKGMQVHSGATGLGLPPVAVQWLEGAGDGATFRGQRVLPRDIDLPLTIRGANREDLKLRLSRVALALADECTLRFVEDNGSSWYTKVRRAGGGDYVYGVDTNGEKEVSLILTVRAGDPFWTSSERRSGTVVKPPTRGLIPKLGRVKVSSGSAMGVLDLVNPGDAPAYPVWTIKGPGRNFKAVSPTGESFAWNGTLQAGETLTVDTYAGRVYDQTGTNRYAEMAPAPRLWTIPPGSSRGSSTLFDVTAESVVTCTWRPRRWLVI